MKIGPYLLKARGEFKETGTITSSRARDLLKCQPAQEYFLEKARQKGIDSVVQEKALQLIKDYEDTVSQYDISTYQLISAALYHAYFDLGLRRSQEFVAKMLNITVKTVKIGVSKFQIYYKHKCEPISCALNEVIML